MEKDEARPESAKKTDGWKPVLGLSDEPGGPTADWREWLGSGPGTVFDQPEPAELMELTVMVPARNEEDCLAACLRSLVNQSEEIFALGKDWELVVVDDHSTDRTAEIARGFAGVRVIEADKPGIAGEAVSMNRHVAIVMYHYVRDLKRSPVPRNQRPDD